MDKKTTDRIQKQIVINASRSRVWRAISDAGEFGAWFRVDLRDVAFQPGEPAVGKMTYPGHEGKPFEILIERIEPERLFSFRWHPYGIDPNYDYSSEPLTLIEFVLEDVDGGTRLTVIESGFDEIPLARRAEAFRMNSEGWAIQVQNVADYVAANP
jgi:uncharacterized protein YndB with AHSA1/START domain